MVARLNAETAEMENIVGAEAGRGPSAAPERRRAYAQRLAVFRLDAALLEQARLGDAYERSVATSTEQSCYLRLEAASLDVSRCDREVKSGRQTDA